MNAPTTHPRVGSRVRLVEDVDRFPDFLARAGAIGTVVEIHTSAVAIAVRLDDAPPGSEPWGGVVYWYANQHADDWPRQLRVIAPANASEQDAP